MSDTVKNCGNCTFRRLKNRCTKSAREIYVNHHTSYINFTVVEADGSCDKWEAK